jgi:hypothetical protein
MDIPREYRPTTIHLLRYQFKAPEPHEYLSQDKHNNTNWFISTEALIMHYHHIIQQEAYDKYYQQN